jgi:putative two-component system response regulator
MSRTKRSGIELLESQQPEAGREGYVVVAVDDSEIALATIEAMIENDGYEFHSAMDGTKALELIARIDPDVVLMDVVMPEVNGFDLCRQLKADEDTRMTPVVLVTGLDSKHDRIRGIEAGCDDFMVKPFDQIELRARIRSLAQTKRLNENLDNAVAVLDSLARLVEARDETTGDHCDRLIRLANAFGTYLGLPRSDVWALARGGVLHDVGKVGIPDEVLLKKGRLTEDEWTVMRLHPVIGAELLAPLRTMARVVPIVRHHHERWDGNGYPDGLQAEGIPLLARVFQLLDAFDALTSERPYKVAFTVEESLSILSKEREQGKWDPVLLERFLEFIQAGGATHIKADWAPVTVS